MCHFRRTPFVLCCSYAKGHSRKTAFAVVSCAVPGLSLFYSPVCFNVTTLGCATFQVHTYRARKLVIDKIFVQSRRLFFVFAVVACAVPGCALYSLVCFDLPTVGVRYFRLTPSGFDCTVFKGTFVQTVSAIVNCADAGLASFYSLLLTCSLIFFAVMIAWS